jgi:hypothetical protein
LSLECIMKIRNKAKKYTHEDIMGMRKNRDRQNAPFSFLHPAISPDGAKFDDDDALAVVADAQGRYIRKGFMKRYGPSEDAERKRDLTALMSIEGSLTAAIHNAIQGFQMFDQKQGQEFIMGMQRAPPPQRPTFEQIARQKFEDLSDEGPGYQELYARQMGNPQKGQRQKMFLRNMKKHFGDAYNEEKTRNIMNKMIDEWHQKNPSKPQPLPPGPPMDQGDEKEDPQQAAPPPPIPEEPEQPPPKKKSTEEARRASYKQKWGIEMPEGPMTIEKYAQMIKDQNKIIEEDEGPPPKKVRMTKKQQLRNAYKEKHGKDAPKSWSAKKIEEKM